MILEEDREFLAHYGVKGMKWGVRNESKSSNVTLGPPAGVVMRKDGSILIKPGANLQRLVRSNGESLPMKDLTYASINAYDNARYIKIIGGKGVFGGGRDQILSLKAVKEIKAPSVVDAVKINSELMIQDKSYRDLVGKHANLLSDKMNPKEWVKIESDPTGRTAFAWYEMTNRALTYNDDFSPGVSELQAKFKKEFMAKGYNAIRDENDFSTKVAKAPIIIFDPQTSLKVTSMQSLTDDLRTANKDLLRNYKRNGQDWIEKQLYDI